MRFWLCFLRDAFFEYDHLISYAEVQEHTVENLNLLCRNHHGLKTSGLIDVATVKLKALNPFNKSRERTSGAPLEMSGHTGELRAGTCTFGFDFNDLNGEFDAIRIGQTRFLGMSSEGGWLALDLKLTSPWGRILLEISKGELSVSTSIWDFDQKGPRLKIRSALGMVDVGVKIRPNGLIIERGMFVYKNNAVSIDAEKIIVGPDILKPPMLMPIRGINNTMSNCTMQGCRVGIQIG